MVSNIVMKIRSVCSGDMSQIVEQARACNVKESLKKFLDLDAGADELSSINPVISPLRVWMRPSMAMMMMTQL